MKGKILKENLFIHNYNILYFNWITLINNKNILLSGMRSKYDEISTLKIRITELENTILKNEESNKIFEEKYTKRKHKI